MMIVTKKSLPRRTVLRGLGAAVALPLLDGMVPAFAATPAPIRRFGACYVPMGFDMDRLIPAAVGPLVVPPLLQPLAAFKDQLALLTGLDHATADTNDAGPHSRVQATWLTGCPAVPSEGPGIRAGISVDQAAAKVLGHDTQLPSLELAIESVDFVGTCGAGYSCVYTNTLAWSTPTTPLPSENNPRAIFERLFGASDSTDSRARLADIQTDRSILDSVTGKISRLQAHVGPNDRTRLAQYLDAVRDVERRIQKAEEQAAREMPVVQKPAGAPASFEEHVKLMFDLLALAFQCDLTRVSTFLMAREASVRSYPEIGVSDSHHPISHHNHEPEKLAKNGKINTYHLRLFGHLLEQLRSTPDGDGSLLDNTIFLYGSGMSDSHLHWPRSLPAILVAGRKSGIKGGQHHASPKGTPFSNLLVTLLDRLNVPADRFGDSTEPLKLLAV